MAEYRFTDYFEKRGPTKTPILETHTLKEEWCIRVIENPIRSEPQEGNRYRFWGEAPEPEGRYLRVVTLADKGTIHNAFPTGGLSHETETDSLDIDLSENPSASSREISEGVVLDYDDRGNLVGIDIDNASTKAEIHKLVVSMLPASVETIPA